MKKSVEPKRRPKQQALLPILAPPPVKAEAATEDEPKREPVPAGTLEHMFQEHVIPSKLKTFVMKITPDLADVMLGNNKDNRSIKQRVLESYVRDIASGDFELTGETIILDDKWNVLNGQHRLNACIKAGKPFDCVVIQGVSRRAFNKMDSGEKRRAADWLTSGGRHEENAKVLAAAGRLLWTFEQGSIGSSKQAITNAELDHVLDKNPGLRLHMTSTFTKSVKGMPGSLVAALRYIFGMYDEKVAEDFFERLGSGERLTRDNPILTLRNRLANKEHLSQVEVAALTIKTWNSFITGEPLTVLRFKAGNLKKGGEQFPKVAGVEYTVEAPKKQRWAS